MWCRGSGVAYDLLGTGRTVLKGSFSKYMGNEAAGVAESVNPMFSEREPLRVDGICNGERLRAGERDQRNARGGPAA